MEDILCLSFRVYNFRRFSRLSGVIKLSSELIEIDCLKLVYMRFGSKFTASPTMGFFCLYSPHMKVPLNFKNFDDFRNIFQRNCVDFGI